MSDSADIRIVSINGHGLVVTEEYAPWRQDIECTSEKLKKLVGDNIDQTVEMFYKHRAELDDLVIISICYY